MKNWPVSCCAYVNAFLVIGFAIYFFLWPFVIVLDDIVDPGLHNGDMPKFTYRWHKSLSNRFPDWALERIASGRASKLSIDNISGTEWPMFSAVYYLWSTEKLQEKWEQDKSVSDTAPVEYAEAAIRAATELIADRGNAAWVIKHWGEYYLDRENLFYRMLLISGLTSFQKLLHDEQYTELLKQQVGSMAAELDDSPYGLLDDYPGECYPVDVLPAIAAIARAQEVLGQDFSVIIQRSLRGFEGERLDVRTHLPAYIADSKTGLGYGPARGVGISYMLVWAAELWPEVAQNWYTKFEDNFWQKGWLVEGVREFPIDSDYDDWLFDVDAGPVIAGYGTAASAFGLAASRVNGRLDHAYPLSAEALAVSWPLPDGTLLVPRLLSNFSDAPYIGEAALLFTFTLSSISSSMKKPVNFRLPMIVYLILFIYLVLGAVLILGGLKMISKHSIHGAEYVVHYPILQAAVWMSVAIMGGLAFYGAHIIVGLICGLILLRVPIIRNTKTSEET